MFIVADQDMPKQAECSSVFDKSKSHPRTVEMIFRAQFGPLPCKFKSVLFRTWPLGSCQQIDSPARRPQNHFRQSSGL